MNASMTARLNAVREHVTHAAAQYGVHGARAATYEDPRAQVRVMVPSPSLRPVLAPVVIDGNVLREVYTDPQVGRLEHLSGPSRFDPAVLVVLYGSTEHPRRGEQCDATCTTDCGHCKGQPVQLPPAVAEYLEQQQALAAAWDAGRYSGALANNPYRLTENGARP